MPTAWLSENTPPGSTTLVLLGPVTENVLNAQCEKYADGVLWLILESEVEGAPPPHRNLRQITLVPEAVDFPEDLLQSFIGLNYEVAPSIRVSAKINPTDPAYQKVLNLVMTKANEAQRARRTRTANGLLRQKNAFRNLAGYLQARLPSSWRNLAEGSLAVVVGAGPSLDVTLPLLKTGWGRPVFITADSALGAMEAHGLTPDFVVNLDPEKTLAGCGSATFCPGIAVLSSHSHPSWKTAWQGKARYLSGRVLTEDWLAAKGVTKTSLMTMNNAGMTALMLADFLGASAVMMVGIDQSSGQGNLRYAQSTARARTEITGTKYHEVPGNYADIVRTPFLSDWKETSEHCAAIAARRPLINFNDRGARLEGAEIIHPDTMEALRDTLANNLKPFEPEPEILDQTNQMDASGIDQIIALLTERCNDLRKGLLPLFAGGADSSTLDKLHFFRELLSEREHATLIGDFAFAVMPAILPGKEPPAAQLDLWLNELQRITWLLEDALLEAGPSDACIGRFLADDLV